MSIHNKKNNEKITDLFVLRWIIYRLLRCIHQQNALYNTALDENRKSYIANDMT